MNTEKNAAPSLDPDMFVTLLRVTTATQADMTAASLESRGITARTFTAVASTIGPIMASASLFEVAVRRGDVDRARRALEEIRLDAAEIDWDQVDVGEMPDEVRRDVERARLRVPRGIVPIGRWIAGALVLVFVAILIVRALGLVRAHL